MSACVLWRTTIIGPLFSVQVNEQCLIVQAIQPWQQLNARGETVSDCCVVCVSSCSWSEEKKEDKGGRKSLEDKEGITHFEVEGVMQVFAGELNEDLLCITAVKCSLSLQTCTEFSKL